MAMEDLASYLGAGTNIAIGANLVTQIAMSSSLAFLWGLINHAQIISHFPLLVVNFPKNAMIFYKMLLFLANFEVIDTDEIKQKVEYELNIIEDEASQDEA